MNREWPAMAQHQAALSSLPAALIEALHDTLHLKPADDSQRTAQPEMVRALHTLDARRQRIVISQSAVGSVKWAAILLQGLCTLVAICNGSQRQQTHLRYRTDSFCNRDCAVRTADRRL